jgi:choline dehydrogenase-like flavoprotein
MARCRQICSDIRTRAATYFHPSGSCRMGVAPTAVVDPQLRVNGMEGRRVVDASIIPWPSTRARMHRRS